MKKFVSWNVNGLRAIVSKGFVDIFKVLDADAFCLQEIKLQEGQIDLELEGYHMFWNYAKRRGYSGTAIFTKEKPISVEYGIGLEEFDDEGRVITLEYPDYYLLTIYTPNTKDDLSRLDFRMVCEDVFRDFVLKLQEKKPVVICGDLNVAHNEIDLRHPKPNIGKAGFTYEERAKFTELLESGFIDTFRYKYPDLTEAYTWWSYRSRARLSNAGWRIDYFVVSESLAGKIADAVIHADVMGSDHCPVEVLLDV